MLEHRNGNIYAYWCRRVNGRVVRTYLSRGAVGIAVERHIASKRAHARLAKRINRERAAEEMRATDQRAVEVSTVVLDLVADVLTASGHHKPKRYIWRKRRLQVVSPSISEAMAGVSAKEADAAGKIQEWLNDRYARAMAGDKAAEHELFPPDEPPAKPAKRKRTVSSLPSLARDNLANVVTETDEPHDVIVRETTKVERDLAGENPSPIVKLLAQLAAATYFDWWVCDGHGKRLINTPDEAKERYRARSYRRYVAALKTLAQVRRLESNMPTTIRVVAGSGPTQVNVGAPAIADSPTSRPSH